MKKMFILVIVTLFLAACQPAQPATQTPLAEIPTLGSPVPTELPQPTATPTPQPPKTLVICVGQEPTTLYLYKGSSRGMWSVLESVYDGPIDTRSYTPAPVILESLPALADGSALFQPVEVLEGQALVDADGNFTYLKTGVRYLPTGCTSAQCAQTWDGAAPVQMDQLRLTFKLLPGLLWSDGAPLTAADSVYSYQLAAEPATPVNKRIVERTAAYTALDELSVEWLGVPGYFPKTFEGHFFHPLPLHLWGALTAEELLNSDLSNTTPLGWGPYVIQEWTRGDHITLARNPNYFRAAEGLPKFDVLVYRFLGETSDSNLEALLIGECDIIDQTTLLEQQRSLLFQYQRENKLKAYVGFGPEVELLAFGIRPASYDDGYTPGAERADFFSDLRVRQAVASCIDRPSLIKTLRTNQGEVPVGLVPPDSPFYPGDLQALRYSVKEGTRLLDEVGWKDSDGDPLTPRVAQGVANVPDGTPFSVNYYTSQADLRVKAAQMIAANLADCGIQVIVTNLDVDQLYAAGPQGALFGRNFDLAQFSWGAASLPPCHLYESAHIPSAANAWLGGNITGFSDPAYDAACQAARAARPEDNPAYVNLYQEVQRLYAAQLPAIPLFYDLKLAAARLDVCNFNVDASARSSLWNLEELSRDCP